MTAAVVELDALANPVRTAAEDHDLRPRRRVRLALLFVRAVEIRGEGFEFRRARVDALERRLQPAFDSAGPDGILVGNEDRRQLTIADACAFQRTQHVGRGPTQSAQSRRADQFDDLRKLGQEPGIDVRELVQLFHGPTATERAKDRPHAPIRRHAQFALQSAGLFLGRQLSVRRLGYLGEQQPTLAELERAEGLHEGFLERAADRHHLAHRLHLRRQGPVGAWELLECPPRHFDDDVIDGRLEGGGGQPRDVVGNLVEVVAEREFCRDLRNREPGRLRRECRGPGHARVHLDDDDAAVFGIDGELNVRSAGLDADPPDDPARQVAHALIFLVGERQCRRDRDAVAGMHSHRIDVLDRADDHEVVRAIAHDLELEFLPADDRFLEQNLVHRAQVDAAAGNFAELLDVVGDAATDAAERERRPDDDRKPDRLDCGDRLLHRPHVAAVRDVCADLLHRGAELEAILGNFDRLDGSADQLDAVLGERAVLPHGNGEVEGGLTANRRQQGIGTFPLDNRCEHFRRQRFDVRAIGNVGVGHDRRRIAVDENDLESLGSQCLARLGSRVVELARLTDDDRSGADDQDPLDVSAFRHS